MKRRTRTDTLRHCLLRAGVLLLMGALAGTFDLLNSTLLLLTFRVVSPAEEEEIAGKDRSALAAASHLTRRGGIRPVTARTRLHRPPPPPVPDPLGNPHPSTIHRSLTGAGIFQHC